MSFDNQAAHYTFYVRSIRLPGSRQCPRRSPGLTSWAPPQEHLTALYFPCLLRTYLAAPFTFDDPQSYALYAYLLKSCLNTIAFTRFVREHPDELWDSFVRIVSTLAKVPPHIWQREVRLPHSACHATQGSRRTADVLWYGSTNQPIEIHETALTCMLGSMVTLSQSLVIFSSKDPYVKLDDSLRADLRLILPRVNSDLFDGTDLMALALVSAPHSRSDLLRGMFMSGTAKYSWIHCEIRVVATAIEQLTCVNDGHEMEACGRVSLRLPTYSASCTLTAQAVFHSASASVTAPEVRRLAPALSTRPLAAHPMLMPSPPLSSHHHTDMQRTRSSTGSATGSSASSRAGELAGVDLDPALAFRFCLALALVVSHRMRLKPIASRHSRHLLFFLTQLPPFLLVRTSLVSAADHLKAACL